MSIAEKYFM
jgi:Calpain family cysteine protease